MIPEVTIVNDLATNYLQKTSTREWVRKSIIPRLVDHPLGAERSLLVLHRASTYQINPTPVSEEERLERAMKYLKAVQMESGSKNVKLDLSSNPGIRGHYRLLAQVREKTRGGREFTYSIGEFRGYAISSSTWSSAFIAPQRDIDVHMRNLGLAYDSMSTQGDSPVDVAMRASFFYVIGNKLIHPFADGNHRGFDRSLELFFAQAGIDFELPQDETGNIPFSERFRNMSGNLAVNFASRFGLDLAPNSAIPLSVHYDRLDRGLAKVIKDGLDNPFFRYLFATVAEALLKWTPNPHSDEIAAVKELAAREGNIQIVRKYH